MSSVGIVTIAGDTNFGNRLQNFALQEVLSSMGFIRVESIEGLPTGETKSLKLLRLASTAIERRGEYVNRLLRRGERPTSDVYTCPPERRRAIREFTDQYIHTTSAQGNQPDSGHDWPTQRFEFLVVGSDQVWNPAFTHANPEWFLDFARREQRVAYAASFGVPSIKPYLTRRFREGLRGFDALSVRESQAARIVERLTGRTPPVVLDPTMLLGPATWERLAQQPASLAGEGYVATFMLAAGDGGSSSDGADLSSVLEYANRSGLKMVDLHDPVEGDLLEIGPLGFIGSIRGAALVITDSFHAAVFATLFHRPFLLVQRGEMNSRFETLLEHTGLSGRMLSGARDFKALSEVDWGAVDGRLEEKRRDSRRFLEGAFGAG